MYELKKQKLAAGFYKIGIGRQTYLVKICGWLQVF